MVCSDGSKNSANDNTLASLENGTLTRGELQRCAKNICEFLMGTRAMDRVEGVADEFEIINRPGDEDDFDADFSAQRALSRNRCIHALGIAAIAAQCSLRMGGTWDGSVKNLRFGWSPLCVFDDGSESMELLCEMGARRISFEDLKDLRNLPRPIQFSI